MTAVSADDWIVTTDEHSSGLEVVLLKRTCVLLRNQFLYAEGGEDEARLAFTNA